MKSIVSNQSHNKLNLAAAAALGALSFLTGGRSAVADGSDIDVGHGVGRPSTDAQKEFSLAKTLPLPATKEELHRSLPSPRLMALEHTLENPALAWVAVKYMEVAKQFTTEQFKGSFENLSMRKDILQNGKLPGYDYSFVESFHGIRNRGIELRSQIDSGETGGTGALSAATSVVEKAGPYIALGIEMFGEFSKDQASRSSEAYRQVYGMKTPAKLAAEMEHALATNPWLIEFVRATDGESVFGFPMDSARTSQIPDHLEVVKKRINQAEETWQLRHDILSLSEQHQELKRRVAAGDKGAEAQLKSVQTAFDQARKKSADQIQQVLFPALKDLQDGVTELVKWKREQESNAELQAKINTAYAVVSGIADVARLIDPKAAQVLTGIGNLVISINVANAAGGLGSTLGVIGAAVNFFSIFFPQPPDHKFEYMRKAFDMVFDALDRLSEQMNDRFNLVDSKLDYITNLSLNLQHLEHVTQAALAQVLFHTSGMMGKLQKVFDFSNVANFVEWQEEIELLMLPFIRDSRLANNYTESEFYRSPGHSTNPSGNWLQTFVVYGLDYSKTAKFTGSAWQEKVNSSPGLLANVLRSRGAHFSSELVFSAARTALRASGNFGLSSQLGKSAANVLVWSAAVRTLLEQPAKWPAGWPRLSASDAEALKRLADDQQFLLETLASEEITEALSSRYQEAVDSVKKEIVREINSPEFHQRHQIPLLLEFDKRLIDLTPALIQLDGVAPEQTTVPCPVDFGKFASLLKESVEEMTNGNYRWDQKAAKKVSVPMGSDSGVTMLVEHDLRALLGSPSSAAGAVRPEWELMGPKLLVTPDLYSSPGKIISEPVQVGTRTKYHGGKEPYSEEVPVYEMSFYEERYIHTTNTYTLVLDQRKNSSEEYTFIEVSRRSNGQISIGKAFKQIQGPKNKRLHTRLEQNPTIAADTVSLWDNDAKPAMEQGAKIAQVLIKLVMESSKATLVPDHGVKPMLAKDLKIQDLVEIKADFGDDSVRYLTIKLKDGARYFVSSNAIVEAASDAVKKNLLAPQAGSKQIRPDIGKAANYSVRIGVHSTDSAKGKDRVLTAESEYENLQKEAVAKLAADADFVSRLQEKLLMLDDRTEIIRAVTTLLLAGAGDAESNLALAKAISLFDSRSFGIALNNGGGSIALPEFLDSLGKLSNERLKDFLSLYRKVVGSKKGRDLGPKYFRDTAEKLEKYQDQVKSAPGN